MSCLLSRRSSDSSERVLRRRLRRQRALPEHAARPAHPDRTGRARGAKWTDEILDEVFDNLRDNRPDLNPAALERTRELMVRAVRDCLVVDYQPLVDAIQLPDPKDRHVLAAAIKSRAQVIVTTNLKDFPADRLEGWNVEAKHPDEFVLDQIDLDRQVVYGAVQRIADAWRNPPGTILDVLDRLERDGLVESAAALRS